MDGEPIAIVKGVDLGMIESGDQRGKTNAVVGLMLCSGDRVSGMISAIDSSLLLEAGGDY